MPGRASVLLVDMFTKEWTLHNGRCMEMMKMHEDAESRGVAVKVT